MKELQKTFSLYLVEVLLSLWVLSLSQERNLVQPLLSEEVEGAGFSSVKRKVEETFEHQQLNNLGKFNSQSSALNKN